MHWKARFVLFTFWFFSLSSLSLSFAAPVTSEVDWVKVVNQDTLYFKLVNQPTTPCGGEHFLLDPDASPEQRQQLYSFLLNAKLSEDRVVVDYDATLADCVEGLSKAYRVTAN